MYRLTILIAASLIVFVGCNSSKKPNEAALRGAINPYLQAQTQTCVAVGGKFPINVPAADQSSETTKLAALEHGGLVQSQNTTAVVQNLANALSLRPKKAEPVKRYTVSSEGQKYFKQILTTQGQSDGFCYGHAQVDSIVKWDEPTTQDGASVTEVTYTYKFQQLADWAKLPDVEQAFPAIKSTVEQAGTNQVVEAHLTNNGWEAGS